MHTQNRTERASERAGGVALALGPSAALLVAGALSGVRDSLGTTNVALILTSIVVAAAVAGRGAGAATAVMAAVSFNFFHTQPYESLRISDGNDIITVVLLAGIGVGVSEIAHRRRVASLSSRSHIRSEHALERIATRLVHAAAPASVWAEVETSMVRLLDLAACRFEPGDTCALPVMPRSGSLVSKELRWSHDGFVLGEETAIAVACDGRTYGHVVLVPGVRSASSVEARRVSVALADLFAISLARDTDRDTDRDGRHLESPSGSGSLP